MIRLVVQVKYYTQTLPAWLLQKLRDLLFDYLWKTIMNLYNSDSDDKIKHRVHKKYTFVIIVLLKN